MNRHSRWMAALLLTALAAGALPAQGCTTAKEGGPETPERSVETAVPAVAEAEPSADTVAAAAGAELSADGEAFPLAEAGTYGFRDVQGGEWILAAKGDAFGTSVRGQIQAPAGGLAEAELALMSSASLFPPYAATDFSVVEPPAAGLSLARALMAAAGGPGDFFETAPAMGDLSAEPLGADAGSFLCVSPKGQPGLVRVEGRFRHPADEGRFRTADDGFVSVTVDCTDGLPTSFAVAMPQPYAIP